MKYFVNPTQAAQCSDVRDGLVFYQWAFSKDTCNIFLSSWSQCITYIQKHNRGARADNKILVSNFTAIGTVIT
eukprot:jgi/Bigna1/58903/fgenesh1_kg.1_\